MRSHRLGAPARLLILLLVIFLGGAPVATGAAAPTLLADAAGITSLDSFPAEEQGAIRQVLAQIDAGGPFAYHQDGTVFGNREGLLPAEPRGYYHEYTVPTPGSPDRGARRIVAGSRGEAYYTNDHYRSFRRLR
jgi:ribonuclease T1